MAELYASELEASGRSTLDAAQDVMEYASHLSQAIGPRPAGTEEEQQASFYIEGLMKDGAGLKTEVEEFRCTPNYELPRVICCIVSAVLAVLSVALPLTIVPALIITLVLAILYALEIFGLNIIGKVAKKGISQNVVGRYIPEPAQGSAETERASKRKRKIIVVAHYDTGKVRAELKGPLFSVLNIIHWIELVCMILIPLILLIRLAFTAGGVFLNVLNVLVVIAAIGAFLPVISYILHQTAQYNNGANCNAAGVAVMAEVARRIGRELPSVDFSENVSMSGEEAIRAKGLVPEGASLTYNSGQVPVIGAQSAPLEIMGAQAVGLPTEDQMQAEFISTGQAFPPSHTPSGAGVDAIFEGIGKVSESQTGASDMSSVAAQNATMASAVASQETGALEAVSTEVAAGSDAHVSNGVAPAVAGAAVAAAAGGAANAVSQPVPPAPAAPEPDDGVPDWFKRGRQKAMEHKPHDESGPTLVQRSRFADALDAAAASTAEAQAQAQRAESAPSIAEQRLQQMRESIMGQAAGAQSSLHNAVHGTSAAQAAAPVQSETPASAAAPNQASQETPAAHSQPSAPDVTGHNAGVGGYLSNTLSSPDYETSAAAQEAAAAANAAEVASKSAAEATVASATAAALATDAAKLAAEADAKANAERAAIASRTMSFIPVALDPNEMKLQNEALKSQSAAVPSQGAPAKNVSVPVVENDEAADAHKRKRREIALPSLTGAIEGVSAKLQDAPINEMEQAEPTEQEKRANRMARQERLAALLPSTDSANISCGSSKSTLSEEPSGTPNVTAGAFSSGTSSFEPVGDELLADVAEDDIYIEDADDSAYVEQTTQTGAFAGPGYVNMPTSRASRMFGRFRKNKKKDEEVSLKDSLGVGDDFDARSVGKARGGWESFRDDDAFDDEWEGGAFSKLKETAASGIGKIGARGSKGKQPQANDVYDDGYTEDAYYDEYDSYDGAFQGGYQSETADYEAYAEDYDGQAVDSPSASRRLGGSRSSSRQSRRGDDSGRMTRKPVANPFGDLPLDFSDNQMEERELIQQFKNGPISTEIWFVALGAEVADNAGIKAFIAEHNQDLRGSVIVDLNGLGAGELSIIEEEGMFRPTKVSSRLKRYANKAANALGIRLASGKMLWRDSAAYISGRRGYQTLHVAGMMNGKPAYCAEADDVFDNLSEEKLRQNSDFVMELIRNI